MASENTKRAKVVNFWHISIQRQDSETHYLRKKRKSDAFALLRKFAKVSLVSGLLVFSFVFPKGAQAFSGAWLFSAFSKNSNNGSSTYSSDSQSLLSYGSLSEEYYHSQNIPLLTPVRNPDINAGRGGGDISVVANSALVPSAGPTGTMANIEDDSYRKGGKISIYVVRKGDTLSEIAKMFDVSVNTIRWANDLGKKGTIKVGQELVILPVSGLKYTVKRGGSIRDIVKKVGGNAEEAAEFNNLDPDEELEKGTVVIIPNAKLKEPKSKAKRVKSYVRSYGSGSAVYAGYFMRPIRGGVRTQGRHGHNAVDIAAPFGTAIYAAAEGKVILSREGGWNGGYGTYIVIQHPNGTQTLYAHNSKNFVKRGDYVKQGQVIAAVGSTGRSTGPHVHFEVRGGRNPF